MEQEKPKNNKITLLLIAGIVFAIISPIIFTRTSVFSCIDFRNTGQIGDTIGGLTAPIIGIVSSILLYVSFQAQLSANNLQISILKEEKKRNKENSETIYLNNLIHELEKKTDNFQFTDFVRKGSLRARFGQETTNYKGIEAISFYCENSFEKELNYLNEHKITSTKDLTEFNNLLYISSEFILIIDLIKKSEFSQDNEILKNINQKIVNLYTFKLAPYLDILVDTYLKNKKFEIANFEIIVKNHKEMAIQ